MNIKVLIVAAFVVLSTLFNSSHAVEKRGGLSTDAAHENGDAGHHNPPLIVAQREPAAEGAAREEPVGKTISPGNESSTSPERDAEHYRIIREIMEDIRLTRRKERKDEKRLRTLYDDGFYLKGEDDQLRIGGWFQGDYRRYPDDDHPGIDTFLIRRALFDVRGVLENDWAYRLNATFIGQKNGVLQEGWLEYRKFSALRLRAGQFTEPFSLEGVYSARWIDFAERAMIVNALTPFEDIGVMAYGRLWDGVVDYVVTLTARGGTPSRRRAAANARPAWSWRPWRAFATGIPPETFTLEAPTQRVMSKGT